MLSFFNNQIKRSKQQLLKTFWLRVKKTDSCWLWKGMIDYAGYGKIWVGQINGTDKRYLAHRLSYRLFVGKIPQSKLVLHQCDVPNCVNPKHLFIGSQLDNMRDKIEKGRANWALGEKLPQSKLTSKKVKKIRFLYESEQANQIKLALMFGVDQSVISRTINKLNWRYVC